MNFRDFILAETSETQDVHKTLAKLPPHHRRLVRGYSYSFQSGSTMKGDGGHVGLIDDQKKKIVLAAPWNYGREFTLLHEIGHLVWKHFITTDQKKQWGRIVKTTKHKMPDGQEELFCMAYANHYSNNKIEIHNHPAWDQFVKKVSKQV